VVKRGDGERPRAEVDRLDDAQRREEIARMLSGATVTDEARAQAARLIGAPA
jgi:DNA repair protein RecN (Recombination protein N)